MVSSAASPAVNMYIQGVIEAQVRW